MAQSNLPNAPAQASLEGAASFPRVAVMGAGAVGCYFGGMLARAGARVTLIGRSGHVEAIRREGLFIESIRFQEHVALDASTEADAVRDAGLVLLAVKTVDTEEACRLMRPHLAPEAALVSLQNGVENAERIRACLASPGGRPVPEVLPAVVYIAAVMAAPGRVKHAGRGDLILGPGGSTEPAPERREAGRAARVAEWFTRAGVPCRVSENIQSELWLKLIMNCAGNAVTALGCASYRRVAEHELAREVIGATIRESLAVARAAGVTLPPVDLVAAGFQLARALGDATSSTAQDIARGKRTEIDALNGYIARRGAELGVPTPVNHTLYALVKLLEESPR